MKLYDWFVQRLFNLAAYLGVRWDIIEPMNDEPVIVVPPQAPTPPVEPAPLPGTKKNYLSLFCSAIRDFEGSPGDLSYRNNNPGNFRCSPVGYNPMYGEVKCVNAFAVFPTYDLGWKYLENSVLYRAKTHPTWDIMDFFLNYAPPGDKNPTEKYARYVAGRCGVSIETKLSEMFG